jgi:hypothetical protein
MSTVISKEVSMQLLFHSFLRNMELMRLKTSDLLAWLVACIRSLLRCWRLG